MADTKITALADASDIALGDKFELVDVSDTTMAATGTNKDATFEQIVEAMLDETRGRAVAFSMALQQP